MKNNQELSIVIPCKNEEKHIADLLNSLALQDYPIKRTNIFIADANSKDKTREIIKRVSKKED